MNSVSIHARYTFPSNDQEEPLVVEKTFDESNCEIARLGLPEGVEAVKVSVKCKGGKSIFIEIIHSYSNHVTTN